MKMNHVSLELVKEVIDFLANQIKSKDVIYDYVVGIGRGGLVPATMMAYKLDLPVLCYSLSTYDDHNKQSGMVEHQLIDFEALGKDSINILVVDDICDTGDTFKWVRDLPKDEIDIETHVALFSKRENIKIPDVIGLVADENEWIVFPWE